MNKQNVVLQNPLNTKGTTITNYHLLHMIQIHDSAFPIGSYTHSFGMETMIQNNQIHNQETLYEFLKTYLYQNLGCGDAIFVKEVYKQIQNDSQWEEIYRLDQLCNSLKIASESRQASKMMGRQFLKTILPINSDSDWLKKVDEELKSRKINGHYAVVYGIYTAVLGIDLKHALMTFLYSSLSNLVQNAVRAIPLGQTAGVKVMNELLAEVEKAAMESLDKTLDDVSNQAIEMEMASMKHEFLFSRLFIS